MRKTLAFVAATTIASASIALPAKAAQPSHPSNFGGFISTVVHFGGKDAPPPPPPTSGVRGVCKRLQASGLAELCEARFPGGGASPS